MHACQTIQWDFYYMTNLKNLDFLIFLRICTRLALRTANNFTFSDAMKYSSVGLECYTGIEDIVAFFATAPDYV
jgi:hypothetical protein